MDALSGAAGTLAVLEATCKSIKFIHHFFQSIIDGPSEVQQTYNIIQALLNTLVDLQSLCSMTELGTQQTGRLLTDTKQCLADVQAAEKRITRIDQQFGARSFQRTWTKIQWALGRSPWLNKFFERVKLWHSILTCDLILLHV